MAIKRALTIDDDVETRRNLRSGLLAASWQVEEAPDGLGGLEQIRRLSAEGMGFNCVISAAILPDLDSKLMLRALHAQYPGLPLIVLTGYPEDGHREELLKLQPLAYLEKPLDVPALLEALFKFDLGPSTAEPQPLPAPPPSRPVEAYAFLRLAQTARGSGTYQRFHDVPGVRIANAVRGDYDLVLRLTTATADELNATIEAVKNIEGAALIALDKLERPRLSPEIEDFIQHYEAVAQEDRAQYIAMHPTNAYLIIDIDRYQLERIYTSIVMTEGVISCQVTGNGSKLIVMMSGAVRPEVARHVLRKVAVMDGIRRVREAPVINLSE